MTLRSLLRAAPVAALVACNAPEVIYLENCQVDLAIDNITASPGDPATLTGGPFTRVADTRVVIGGVDATVVNVGSNDDCIACFDCRGLQECDDCGLCEACESSCDTCVEFIDIVVPALAPGEYAVMVFNEHGNSLAATLTVVPGDTSVVDTSTSDTGPSDTALEETGDTDPTQTADTALPTGDDTATP